MSSGWHRTARGTLRRVYGSRSQSGARSDFPCPQLIRDFAEPVQSSADGKFYTSKRALARSARADHNPHGQDFVELGTEDVPFREHVVDERGTREAIRQGIRDFDDGWRPEVAVLEE